MNGEEQTLHVFICYRRGAGGDIAEWLYEKLNGTRVEMEGEAVGFLNVYLDREEHSVADWIDKNRQALQLARALIILCTRPLVADYSPADGVDWVQQELDWWRDNRQTPPILIDTQAKDRERCVPPQVRKKWPRVQGILIEDLAGLRRNPVREAKIIEDVRQSILDRVHQVENEEVRRWRNQARRLKALAYLLSASLLAVFALLVWHFVLRGKIENSLEKVTHARAQLKIEQDEKEKEQKKKDRALLRAEGERLISLARSTLAKDPTLALLLAVEGAEKAPGPNANNVLFSALGNLRALRAFRGHLGPVLAADFHPDGSMVVTGGTDRTARVWDLERGGEFYILAHDRPVAQSWFVPDKRELLTVTDMGIVTRWSLRNGMRKYTFGLPGDTNLDTVQAASDRRFLICQMPNRIEVIDSDDGRLIWTWEGERSPVLSGDGSTLVTIASGELRIRDTSTWTSRRVPAQASEIRLSRTGVYGLVLPTHEIWHLSSGRMQSKTPGSQLEGNIWASLTPDGHFLVVLGNNKLSVFNVGTSELLNSRRVHGNLRGRPRVHPDSRSVVLLGDDGEMTYWNFWQNAEVSWRHPQGAPEWSRFSPDGRFLLTADAQGDIIVWDTEDPLAGRRPAESGVRSPASFLFTHRLQRARDKGSSHIIDPDLISSPHGRFFLALSKRSDSQEARLYNQMNGREIGRLPDRPGVLQKRFTPSGNLVLTHPEPDEIHVYRCDTFKLETKLKLEDAFERMSSAISSFFDEREEYAVLRFLFPRDSPSTSLWHLASGKRVGSLPARGRFFPGSFGADGGLFATSLDNGVIELWSMPECTFYKRLEGHRGPIRDLAFSPNGLYLFAASADGRLGCWDLETGEKVWIQTYSLGSHPRIAVSPDNMLVAVTDSKRTLSLVDAFNGNPNGTIPCRHDFAGMNDLRFTEDGQWIQVYRASQAGEVWPRDPLAEARRCLPRDFHVEELSQFKIDEHAEFLEKEFLEKIEFLTNSVLNDHPEYAMAIRSIRLREDLDPKDKRYTIRELKRRSSQAREEVLTWVDRLFEEFILLADVRKEIERDGSISEERRRWALHIASRQLGDSGEWAAKAFSIASDPASPPREYQRALRMVEAAMAIRPDEHEAVLARSLALARLGKLEDAKNILPEYWTGREIQGEMRYRMGILGGILEGEKGFNRGIAWMMNNLPEIGVRAAELREEMERVYFGDDVVRFLERYTKDEHSRYKVERNMENDRTIDDKVRAKALRLLNFRNYLPEHFGGR